MNSFVNSDFLDYEPTHEFDVILFRESMYHIPYGQVLPILKKFSKNLKTTGVFIVRLYAGDHRRPGVIKTRVTAKLDLIKSEFDVLEAGQFDYQLCQMCWFFGPDIAPIVSVKQKNSLYSERCNWCLIF